MISMGSQNCWKYPKFLWKPTKLLGALSELIFVNMQGLSVNLKYVHNASLNAVELIPNVQPRMSKRKNTNSKSTEDSLLASSSH